MKKIIFIATIAATLVCSYYAVIYQLQHEKHASHFMIVLSLIWGAVTFMIGLSDD